jgi:hypothetical protein
MYSGSIIKGYYRLAFIKYLALIVVHSILGCVCCNSIIMISHGRQTDECPFYLHLTRQLY